MIVAFPVDNNDNYYRLRSRGGKELFRQRNIIFLDSLPPQNNYRLWSRGVVSPAKFITLP